MVSYTFVKVGSIEGGFVVQLVQCLDRLTGGWKNQSSLQDLCLVLIGSL